MTALLLIAVAVFAFVLVATWLVARLALALMLAPLRVWLALRR
jgi:hypothetical protein